MKRLAIILLLALAACGGGNPDSPEHVPSSVCNAEGGDCPKVPV